MYSINHNPANRKIFNKFSSGFLIEATQWEKNKTLFSNEIFSLNNKNFSNHLLNWLEYVMQIDCCLSTCFCLGKIFYKKNLCIFQWFDEILQLFTSFAWINRITLHQIHTEHNLNIRQTNIQLQCESQQMWLELKKIFNFIMQTRKLWIKSKTMGKSQSTHKINIFSNISTELEIIGNFSIR